MFFELSGLALTVSAMFVLLMAGLILYQTSNIIHCGETNYSMASVSLYVAIYNLLTSLLQGQGRAGQVGLGNKTVLVIVFRRQLRIRHTQVENDNALSVYPALASL